MDMAQAITRIEVNNTARMNALDITDENLSIRPPVSKGEKYSYSKVPMMIRENTRHGKRKDLPSPSEIKYPNMRMKRRYVKRSHIGFI
jgi:hypothetical protein